ncbi:conserved hypothetical protein [Thermosinus carboxydivorans Nor1]|uniref:Uncharacterized protein n=1 Tax=Thermosinus carboxydivorans Nor1 TaxID=401526 RepID=A1HLT2_9FIRM|nr:hypothetical protein [Thermosinus carboxydivorans]EAX48787.1 conserved hypothetical protein [Thermosinus carboxydivorans Nor1]
MFGSVILEVLIGIAFVYAVLSLTCTVINEYIAAILKLRPRMMEAGLRGMLKNNQLVDDLYSHPLINTLSIAEPMRGLFSVMAVDKPAYIPAQSFSVALLDIVKARCPVQETGEGNVFTSVVEGAKAVDCDFKNMLVAFANQAEGNLAKLQDMLEKWFISTMEHLSAWYRKQMQLVAFLVALGLAAATNADTLEIAGRIYHDAAMRGAIVLSAVEAANVRPDDPVAGRQVARTYAAKVTDPQLPLGWREFPQGFGQWLQKLLGLLLTTFAVSLGAPFWFDMLNKVMNFRWSGVKPRPASPGDGSNK